MNDLTPERIEEYERTADEILRMAPLDRAPVGQWPQRVKDLAAALREAQAENTRRHSTLWLLGLETHNGEEQQSREDSHRNLDELLDRLAVSPPADEATP